MATRTRYTGKYLALSSFGMIALAGCFGSGGGLPSSVTVELPDGTSMEVEQGTGAASLADTEWQFYRTAEAAQGLSFVTLRFGANGGLESFEDNTIAQEIFGSSIRFDGTRHSTAQKGLSYAASTYGAETFDGTGFSFLGRMTAFAAGIPAGYATATATGTYDPDDPNTMTGTFTYTTRVTLPVEIPEAEQDEEFAFIAHRVVE
ncbi:MAG: hypothetical protein WBE26_19655 [Phycisphaerae bacterium]